MPRAIWAGTISFGLVSIPVKLYSAIKQKDVTFHQVEQKTGARIRYKRVSAKTGQEVDFTDIAKGYELDKERMVVIDPEEIEELMPKATHSVDISDFVDLHEIDPIHYERTYYLAPGTGGAKAYKLLHEAMRDSERVGIGRVVIRTKQYLAAIRPKDGVLCLTTMLFADEVVDAKGIEGLPVRGAKVDDRELKMARQLVDSLSRPFDPERYEDTYRSEVLSLIRKKAKGKTVPVEEPEREEAPKVADLMDALRRSVESTKSPQGAKSGAAKRRASGKRERKSA